MTTETLTIPTTTVPTRTWSAVLFDLDGTIVDSASDITGSLAHMFAELGLEVPNAEQLLAYVGPPLLDSLRLMGGFDDAGVVAWLTELNELRRWSTAEIHSERVPL